MCRRTKKGQRIRCPFLFLAYFFSTDQESSMAACAAARRAIGTRGPEHET